MSATLGAGNFFSYFAQRRVELAIPGRNFEVEIVYNLSPLYAYSLGYYSTMAESNYFELAIEKVKEVHTQERNTPGDILLFMTGEEVGIFSQIPLGK
jgi:HrpA-like RNA helicase